MAKPTVTVTIEDVNGTFARLVKESPQEARVYLSQAVSSTTVAVKQRMSALVPVDEGDLRAALDVRLPKRSGLSGEAGVLNDAEQAAVARFNEWSPNNQPFMRTSAEAESSEFSARAIKALKALEADLSRGV